MMKIKLAYIFIFFFTSLVYSQQNIVADLKVKGNKKTKLSFVKKISTIKAGDKLDSLILDQDIKRLQRLPSVGHAYYQVFHSHDNEYNVFYNIEENFTIVPSLNVYTSTNDEFAFRAGVYEFNSLGRNITFGGFYQQDIYGSYAVNFRAPYLFSSKLGLAFNYQNLTTQEPVFFPNTSNVNYKYNNESYETLGLYEINFKNRIEAGVNFFTEDYLFKSGESVENIPEDKLSLVTKKVLYKFIYEYNNLDFYYQYISGFKSMLNVQYVKNREGVDLPDFLIWWNDFFYFKRIGEKGNWANRLRVGLASNNDSPFAPFSVDNNLNVRGVGNIIDRGTGVIVLNTEYRYTLHDKKWLIVQGNAFVDAGSWRNPGGDFGDFSNSQNIRVYPGLGVRFTHKKIFNATFRIDYGYGITKDAARGLVFGIGQYF